MEQIQLNWIANFIWGIADDILRDLYVRGKYRDVILTNAKYQEITGTSRATAKRDLEELVHKGLIILIGTRRGAYYQVPKKWLINGSYGSSGSEAGNGS